MLIHQQSVIAAAPRAVYEVLTDGQKFAAATAALFFVCVSRHDGACGFGVTAGEVQVRRGLLSGPGWKVPVKRGRVTAPLIRAPGSW
jgi:hypothetical protein